MDNAPGIRFVSPTFLVGFGIGVFIGVGLALIAFAIARPEDEEPRFIEIPVLASPTSTPLPEDTPLPQVRSTAALTVRVGPGEAFATLGTISNGDVLDVLGRDFDSDWLAIAFPPGSASRGWIPATEVEGLTFSKRQALAVLLPTPLPIEFITPPPFFGTPGTPGTGTPEADETPGPLAGTSDLAIFRLSASTDGRVSAVVLNGGPADLNDNVLTVTVRDLGGNAETMTYVGLFPAGATITFTTDSFRIGPTPTQVQVVVDPSSSLNDPNRVNNVETTELSTTEPAAQSLATPGPS
jgi:uncharacterized protein YgiM (DUF1202 family)